MSFMLSLQLFIIFKNEGEIKNFPDNQKLKEFVTTKPVLQDILKGLLQEEKKKQEEEEEEEEHS